MLKYSLVTFVLLAGCDVDGSDDFDAGIESERGQGSEARGDLVINEFMAKPASGADWLELYNRSDVAIDLCDYFVTDSLGRLDHYHHLGATPPPEVCEGKMLGAGEYLVIVADDNPGQGPSHAPFKLGVADEVHVVTVLGEATDSVLFLHPDAMEGLSLSRQPNGEGLFWLSEPSRGTLNPVGVGR